MLSFLMVSQLLFAQSSTVDSTHAIIDTMPLSSQMDIIDVLKKVFRPNKVPKKEPGSGSFFWTAIPYPTYSIATGFAAAFPVNLSFYTNPKERGELSFFNNMFQYTQFNQTIAFSLSNLFFGHDKWELIGDWRFYNFPTYTYGLGTNTTAADQDRIDYSYVRVYELVMRRLAPNFDVGLGYHLDYRWDIEDEAFQQQGIITDFQAYGFSKRSTSTGFSANLLYDSRSNANTPRTGTYLSLQFRVNLQAMGSNSNWNQVIIDARKYVPLPTGKWRTLLAFWGYGWFVVNGNAPYLDLPSTGGDMFNNTGRGYALGRYRGTDMLYFETEFRFGIMRNGLLGGVVFANMESYTQWPATYFGDFQPGVGCGLRLKLNKRTDTNSAIDFGIGTHGSKGFAFNLNEVF